MKPTLSLKRERLTELTADDLTQVAGGHVSRLTCPIEYCLGLTYNSCNCCTASGSC